MHDKYRQVHGRSTLLLLESESDRQVYYDAALEGLAAIGTAVLILLAYAVVLFAVAIWRFRFD